MIPLYASTGPQTVLGLPCDQGVLSLPTWEYAFKQLKPERVIEIGSGTGAFTYALQMILPFDKVVCSFDITKAPSEHFPKLFNRHPMFVQRNVFHAGVKADIADTVAHLGVTYLLCDGGNKWKEFETFAPALKRGDVIGVHDFASDAWPWSEITLAQTEPFAKKIGLERWLPEEFEAAGWLVYRRL